MSALTFVSFVFMVRLRLLAPKYPINDSLFKVVSSVIAAWSDISTVTSTTSVTYGMNLEGLSAMSNAVYKLNVGYLWMLINCLTSAAYVCLLSTAASSAPADTKDAGTDDAKEDKSDRVYRLGLDVLFKRTWCARAGGLLIHC